MIPPLASVGDLVAEEALGWPSLASAVTWFVTETQNGSINLGKQVWRTLGSPLSTLIFVVTLVAIFWIIRTNVRLRVSRAKNVAGLGTIARIDTKLVGTGDETEKPEMAVELQKQSAGKLSNNIAQKAIDANRGNAPGKELNERTITKQEAERLVATIPYWHQRFEVFPDVTTPGAYDPGFLWNLINQGRNWQGSRVIDIGPAEGAFSKWAADQGATVTVLDRTPKHWSGFHVMEQLSGQVFNYRVENVLDVDLNGPDVFDVVLFLGVLYHLPDLLRSLYVCRKLCAEDSTLFLESWIEPELVPDVPTVRYLPHGEHSDMSIFWVPNRAALYAMVHDAGFDIVRDVSWGQRIFVEARVSQEPARMVRIETSYGTGRR